MKRRTREWLKAAARRAAWTVAQTALGAIGTTYLITDVDWRVVLSASALAGIASLLKSIIAGMPEAPKPVPNQHTP
jgi:hypothetical protein